MGLLIRVVNEGGYVDVGAGSVCIYICMMSVINVLNCGIYILFELLELYIIRCSYCVYGYINRIGSEIKCDEGIMI